MVKESRIDPAIKRPTWVLTIGIVCMILGLFRFFSSYELTMMPETIEKSREILEKIDQDSSVNIEGNLGLPWLKYKIKTDSITEKDREDLEKTRSFLNHFLEPSSQFLKWIVTIGVVGMAVALIYILGGILLLVARPFSVKFIYFSLGLSIVYYAFVFMVLLSGNTASFLGYGPALSRGIAVLIDLTLIGFAIGGTKDYFNRHLQPD